MSDWPRENLWRNFVASSIQSNRQRAAAKISRAAALLGCLLSPCASWAESVPVCRLEKDIAYSIGGDEDRDNLDAVAASSALPTATSATLLTSCGIGTEIAETFPASALRVSFQDGAIKEFYPLLLTDKTPGLWTCNKIKVRTACVVRQDINPDGSVSVTLKTKIDPLAATETHRVLRDGAVVPPADGKYFVLLPRFRLLRGKLVDRGLKVAAAVEDYRSASGDNSHLAERNVAGERAALAELRRFRMPRVLSESDRESDATTLQALTDQLAGDERLIHRAIAASEIGWVPGQKRVTDSPFELVDAILGNSGPSYGIHQIDLATNGGSDVVPFRLAMPEILKAMGTTSTSPLKPPAGPIGTKRFAFEKPIRGWNIALTAEFYRSVPYAVAAIRSYKFRDKYISVYHDYLRSSAACMKGLTRLGGIFLTSKVAQLYIVDVANQFGSSRAATLAQAAKDFDGSDDGFNEDGMRDFMIAQTGYGQTNEGAADIRRRFENIRHIADSADAAPTSASGKCNIPGLSR